MLTLPNDDEHTLTPLLHPIAHILTPFAQKFSIPRQGLSLSCAKGELVFSEHINTEQALDGISDFSHLWLLFLFHENAEKGYKSKVRPPRLGGNKKVGVFATRSSFRPNNIGMSVVKNLGVSNNRLYVQGVDLLTNTPIIDIKPYLPYADSLPHAQAGFAQEKPIARLTLTYSEIAQAKLPEYQTRHEDIVALIDNILTQDPRPSYKQNKIDDRIYVIHLYDIEISWTITHNTVNVLDIYPAKQ
jgi:tRNA-Thr(GGU) m(6)t(6)A37 methyltransferase TsaA